MGLVTVTLTSLESHDMIWASCHDIDACQRHSRILSLHSGVNDADPCEETLPVNSNSRADGGAVVVRLDEGVSNIDRSSGGTRS